MPYDPRAPFHERYVKNPPAYDPALLARVERDAITLCRALGYDLNTVEFAVEDGVPYAIDFMNPAPDAEVTLRRPGQLRLDRRRDGGPCRSQGARTGARAPVPLGRPPLMSTPTFTLGIEEEYQTIDPDTFDLRSHIQMEIIEKGKRQLQERVKAEMHQSVIEVGTGVCRNVKEAAADLKDLRRRMIALTEENGLRLVAGATHPFADWRVQDIYPDERYRQVVEDMQIVARANLIFGLHIHVGIEDRETLIHLMNQLRYFLPHLLALSTNSPFWIGMNTGLKSYRCKVFDRFPADEHSRHLHVVGGLRELRQPAGPDEVHRQRQEDLVGHPAASVLRHGRVPHLRHPDARGRDHRAGGAGSGHRRQAPPPARAQSELAPVQPRPADGEQVAGLTLRHRRHAHRLRPRVRGPRARAHPRVPGIRRRRAWTSWTAARRSSTSAGFSTTGPAPIASFAPTKSPARMSRRWSGA